MKKIVLASLALITALIIALVSTVFYLILSRPTDVLDRLEQIDMIREYFSSLEAIEVIRPTIAAWNSDAVITGIRGSTWHGREGIYASLDERMAYWTFKACSMSAKEWTRAVLLRGYAGIGWGERPGGDLQGDCQVIPVEQLLDTDIVIKTAKSRVNDSQPNEVRLSKCDQMGSTEYLCWNVEFDIPPNSRVQVSSDAYTGEVLNIFQVYPEKEDLGKDWNLE